MGVTERYWFKSLVQVLLVILIPCLTQAQETCPTPCALGFTCYRARTNRVGHVQPSCIPLREYIAIIQRHRPPPVVPPHSHRAPLAIPPRSHRAPPVIPPQGRRTPPAIPPQGRRPPPAIQLQDPRPQHAVPPQRSSQGFDMHPSHPGQPERHPVGQNAIRQDHVSTATGFERQLSGGPHLGLGKSEQPDPNPVNPSVNDRKRVSDVIEELVLQPTAQQAESARSRLSNQSQRPITGSAIIPDTHNGRDRGHAGHGGHGGHVDHGHNVDNSGIGHMTDSGRHPVTETPQFVDDTTATPPPAGPDVEIGRTSSILSDDSGYYFMFYARVDFEGVRVNITRSGFCPRVSQNLQSTECLFWCTSDSDCDDTFKCCPNGCSLTCAPPGRR